MESVGGGWRAGGEERGLESKWGGRGNTDQGVGGPEGKGRGEE